MPTNPRATELALLWNTVEKLSCLYPRHSEVPSLSSPLILEPYPRFFSGQHRTILSIRSLFGGCFAVFDYQVNTDTNMTEIRVVASPEELAFWKNPPEEWESILERFRLENGFRPEPPIGAQLRLAIENGLRERAELWAMEKNIVLPIFCLIIDQMRVHPVDTTPGICKEAGRRLCDELALIFLRSQVNRTS